MPELHRTTAHPILTQSDGPGTAKYQRALRARKRKPRITPNPDPTLDTTWMDNANCKGHHHLFFPAHSEHKIMTQLREQRAARLCAECPVVRQCQQYATVNNEYGYWGGQSR